MRTLKSAALFAGLFLGVFPLGAQEKPTALDQVVDRIIRRENAEMVTVRQYSPLVETYLQELRPDKRLGTVPAGDKYFLGRAELAKGVTLESLSEEAGLKRKMFGGLAGFFTLGVQFLPRGFLQMIYADNEGLDRGHYNFDYVRREFLGEVRCLVFDVTPKPKSGRGRFLGRIWVEDQDYTIVRFNGAYTGSSKTSYYFHFDSWRVNAGPNLWLPAYIYSEESDAHGMLRRLHYKSQTRLWGYNLGHAKQEEEFSKILVEAPTPVQDQTQTTNDLAPIQAQRAWDRQAENNVVDRMERLGLLAPRGDVDKVLETVVNNLEVTNSLDIQPEVRCRVLTTSTLESFAIGHTIVLSRGLVDVLPDEASLATMLAHELSHVVLGHRIDSQYAFFDRLLFDEKETFKHFGFARTRDEEEAANQKATELLQKSPYKDQLATSRMFLQVLQSRAKEIPNLISPHLGDRVTVAFAVQGLAESPQGGPAQTASANSSQLVALPLGSRIKMNPWNGQLEMLKSKPMGTVAEREKMPFEVTPFMLYLTRETSATQPPTPQEAAEAKPDPTKKPQ